MTRISIFTRRRFLATGAAVATTFQLQRAALALGFSQSADVCRLTPEQEVGPYYVADELLRSNIAESKPGVPLALRIVVLDARTCKPLQNAAIDIWHCDAQGVYSGFTKQSMMGPGGFGPGPDGPGGPPPDFDPQQSGPPGQGRGPMGPPPASHPSDKLTFLRGIQLTGSDGAVSFLTVFPGFYPGRTNHIHFKVREEGRSANKTYQAGHTSHVGQVFFPEDIAVELMQHPPYSLHKIHRTTRGEDHVFGHQHGDFSIARLQPVQPGNFAAGLQAELVAAVDPAATPAPVQMFGGPPGPGPE